MCKLKLFKRNQNSSAKEPKTKQKYNLITIMEPIPAVSFGKSHLKLIGASILLLIAALFMRGGFTLGSFGLSQADSAPKRITLAEAQAQAHQIVMEQSGGVADGAALAEKTQEQLAEIDPNFGGGAVLGASVGDDGNLNVDELLNSSAIKSAQINIYQTQDPLQFTAYSSQVHDLENKYGAIILMTALSTRDQASLQKAQAGYKSIIAGLQAMQVPSQFEEFHRIKLVYYSALATMAESMASEGPNEQAATATSLFFSLNDKLESLSAQLASQYGVML